MSINVKGILGGAARVAAGAALLVAAGSAMSPAHAKLTTLIGASSGGSGDGPLLATYFDLSGPTGIDGDAIIRLANISGSPECALIYVFDTDQQLQEACSVGLSANKELALSVGYELTANPAFSSAFEYGVDGLIEVVSATPVTTNSSSPFASSTEGINCDPSQTVVPITAVEAWIEHTLGIEVYGTWDTGVAVVPFTNGGDPDAANLAALQNAITFLGSSLGSSGDGICSTDPYYGSWDSDS
ncbi:MAG: hypothetical protein ABSG46_00400 [Candidatus Binataceae bacterium]|jgi:hypothetical protein